MIFIGLGSNLPLSNQSAGAQVLHQALEHMDAAGLKVRAVSQFYRSEPVPVSDQDWYVNAVAQIETNLEPAQVLAHLHDIEAAFERVRTVRNAARTLDLDLLAYGQKVQPVEGPAPHIPHPRMTDRAFVLLPLRDLAPDWCHPVTGASLEDLIAALPADQRIEPLEPRL